MANLMIIDGFAFLTVIVTMCASLLAMEQALNSRLLTWFPPIVLVMFGAMLGYTLGIWEFTESVRETRESARDRMIPMMLFLMSLEFRFTDLKKLGLKIKRIKILMMRLDLIPRNIIKSNMIYEYSS